MRVTDRMMFENAAAETQLAKQRLEEAVRETSTGKRVVHPSDDPGGAAMMILHKASAERLAAIGESAARAGEELTGAHDAIQGMISVFQRAKELSVQLSNASYSAKDRAAAASEIDGLFNTMVGLLNKQVGDRYIFGGNKDDVPPFDQAGTYLGDTGTRQVEIAPGVMETVSVRADVVVKGAGGGLDVMGALSAFAAALRANDITGIRTGIDEFDTGLEQLVQGITEAGAAVATLDTAQAVNVAARDAANQAAARIGDADFVESASKLALANHALEASLTATAKLFESSLVNRLR